MQPVEIVLETDLKNYRYFGEEAEALGKRLDAARAALANAESEWATNHWQQVLDRLLTQWRMLPALHDGEAQVTIIPRWTIDYDFFEKHDGMGYGMLDRIFDSSKADLNASWERARNERLNNCNCH